MAEKHTYLKTHKISGQVLQFQLTDQTSKLRGQAAASTSGRASKTLVKEGPLRITHVALRKGARLTQHQVDAPVSLQVLQGRLRLTTANGDADLGSGALVALDAGVSHAATALSDCVILITTAMQ